MQILVVEDEVRLAEALKEILSAEKYMVDMVHHGQDALDYGESGIYDLIVLDVMIPQVNGYEVAKRLRQKKITTPIIMLTAKDSVPDKVVGLDSGADDYLTKPFAPEELLARIRALTRRQGEVVLDEITFEDITLNLSTCDVCCQERCTHLNYKEFEILKLLMTHSNSVVTKENLITKVWGYDSDASDNNVEAYISFLRKKLSYLQSRVTIVSLRKVGYRLKSPNKDEVSDD